MVDFDSKYAIRSKEDQSIELKHISKIRERERERTDSSGVEVKYGILAREDDNSGSANNLFENSEEMVGGLFKDLHFEWGAF